ncbi:MAG: nitrogen fixation protein [Acidobacteria bacterium]|nr:MAG: nitrogen fixation protein [Acidobacteriota bacterium]
MKKDRAEVEPLCPSAQPEMAGSVAFGVVGGTPNAPRMEHLERTLPVTDELLALSAPVSPAEVFRFAAPCAGHACQHFDGTDCRLATRIVQILPAVTNDLPPCLLRPDCRWWQQEGKAACLRCPQVVTESYVASDDFQRAADPHTSV